MPDSLSCIPYGIRGTFQSTKILDFPVKWTQPKQLCICSLSLQEGYKKVVLGTPINFSNEKAHFSLANQNDQTGHNGPPSMAVTNIPVGPVPNGSFHQVSNQNFGLNGKCPNRSHKMKILQYLITIKMK